MNARCTARNLYRNSVCRRPADEPSWTSAAPAADTCGQLGVTLLPGSGAVAPVSPTPVLGAAAAAGAGPSTNSSIDGSGPGGTGGSTGSQQPQTCTAAACPHAEEVSVPSRLQDLLLRGSPAGAAAPPPPLLVNRAPLLGEGSGVWLLAPNQTLLQLVRVSEFVR